MLPIGPSTASTADVAATATVAKSAPTLPPSEPGPALVHIDGGRWIPQGQAHVPQSNQLLTTYNDGASVILSVQDAASTEGELTNATLGAPPPPADLNWFEQAAWIAGNPAPDKGGGVAVDGDNVYVADTQGVYRYSLSALQAAAPGETVPALDFTATANSASYITAHDGALYVGEFGVPNGGYGSADYGTDPSLTRYDLADDGSIGDPTGTIETPPYAQGVVVTEQGLLYSTSLGSNPDESPHALVFQPFADYAAFQPQTQPFELFGIPLGEGNVFHTVLETDYYAEELNIVGDEVWITYESNAGDYAGKYEDNLGVAPDNGSVQRIPLDALDLDGTGTTADDLAAAAAP